MGIGSFYTPDQGVNTEENSMKADLTIAVTAMLISGAQVQAQEDAGIFRK